MRPLILIALLLITSISVYSAAALAGPFEDAKAAYDQGDYQTALKLLQPLADQGDAPAQRGLGAMYSGGKGVPQDDTEALKWFQKAADQGDAKAQYDVGLSYDKGEGVSQDNSEAVKWYRKAAAQGLVQAQYNLCVAYAKGQGVSQDNSEALKWCRKAAEQGLVDAQYLLGVLYNEGRGIPQDYTEAAKWYRKAADQGNADAKRLLSVMYANGQATPNPVKPHAWQDVPACDDKAIQQRLPAEVQARLQKDALQDPSPSSFVRLNTSQYTLSLGHETDDQTNLKRICDLMIVFAGGQAPEQYHYTISVKDIGQSSYVDLQIAKGFYAADTK